jgi:G:T-mismatch repair DNA endonuclease (very short patch repair protein)
MSNMIKLDEKKILKEYLNGKSSLVLASEFGVSKPTILKILKKNNVTRKRDRCNSLTIIKKDDFYVVERICPTCKKTILTKSKNKTIACRNHFNKIEKNMKCKKCSLESQIGTGNPFYGKNHTKKTKKEISKSRKGKGMGQNNSMSNPIHRRKVGEILRKKWSNGSMEHVRKIMSDKLKETRRLGKIKSGITSKKEKEISSLLKKKGLKVITSYRIDSKVCDIFLPDLNLIIEYFGDYWHCNPLKYDANYFNQKKNMTAKEIWNYDKSKIDLIKNNGYNLEVIWESELKHDNNKIINILNKHDTKQYFAPERS